MPAVVAADRKGFRKAAARRGTEVRLDAQGVHEGNASDGLSRQPLFEFLRPAGAARNAGVLDVLHREHQCGRRLTPRHRADHASGLAEAGPNATETPRRAQSEQVGLVQSLEILEREGAGAVVLGGGPREVLREFECPLLGACLRWPQAGAHGGLAGGRQMRTFVASIGLGIRCASANVSAICCWSASWLLSTGSTE